MKGQAQQTLLRTAGPDQALYVQERRGRHTVARHQFDDPTFLHHVEPACLVECHRHWTREQRLGGDQFRNAQNTQVLLGKLLRLDVDRPAGNLPYGIPADNPYASGAGGNRPEIWAYGLRNPWRYTFDRGTGDLYIADVGQNVYEEINVQPAGSGGQNYGWPRMEAAHCFPETTRCDMAGLTVSVAEYSHSDGCSVTGGYVYRGPAYPQLTGAYIFGDYCSGRIWTLYRPAGGQWVKTQALQSTVQISSFGEDEAGEIYATGLSDGRIYRVAATAR